MHGHLACRGGVRLSLFQTALVTRQLALVLNVHLLLAELLCHGLIRFTA
jgi:hypothetical protein